MYIALDIETTGLNPVDDQILSIAMVADDLVTPIDELKKFYMIIKRPRYTGQAIALAMNKDTLLEIENGVGVLPHKNVTIITADTFRSSSSYELIITPMRRWLESVHGKDELPKVQFAGKNVAMFDLPFIQQAYSIRAYCYPFVISHRIIDVGSMFYDPKIDGTKVPDFNTCKQRAGILTPVSHHALDDAMDVVHCIRSRL